MMGGEGLTRATQVAILNANYIASRLAPALSRRLYGAGTAWWRMSASSTSAPIKERTGITAEDVAKRLVDYGFHAPTMSWPVPETMMIEPTESESQAELDRFCEAMIAIREEIARVERGQRRPRGQRAEERPAHPRPAARRLDPPLFQGEGLLPAARAIRDDKYWPPVGRVDNVYGDRHLVCACPPPDELPRGGGVGSSGVEDQRRFGRGGRAARCDCCKGFDDEVLGEVGVGDRVPEGDVESADQRVRLVGGREIGEIPARAAVETSPICRCRIPPCRNRKAAVRQNSNP